LIYQFMKVPGGAGCSGRTFRLERGIKAAMVSQLVAGITESVWVVPLFAFLFWFGFALLTTDARRENC
jgi:hypothetical protein